jgi:hypothetical protein
MVWELAQIGAQRRDGANTCATDRMRCCGASQISMCFGAALLASLADAQTVDEIVAKNIQARAGLETQKPSKRRG